MSMSREAAEKRVEELLARPGVDKAHYEPAEGGGYVVKVMRSRPDGTVSGDVDYVGEK